MCKYNLYYQSVSGRINTLVIGTKEDIFERLINESLDDERNIDDLIVHELGTDSHISAKEFFNEG